jgi:hypothetical protein
MVADMLGRRFGSTLAYTLQAAKRMRGLAIITGGTRLSAMGTRILMLLLLAVIGLGLAACGAHRTDVYLWPPADDVNDP